MQCDLRSVLHRRHASNTSQVSTPVAWRTLPVLRQSRHMASSAVAAWLKTWAAMQSWQVVGVLRKSQGCSSMGASERRGCHDCSLLCRDTDCMTTEAVPVQTARCCGSAWRTRGWSGTQCWCWTRRTSAASTPTSCSACSRAWCTAGGHTGAQPGSDCETAVRRADRAALCSWEPGQEQL